MGYLSVMPEAVAFYEDLGFVNETYLRCLSSLGLYYYSTFNLEMSYQTYQKAYNIITQDQSWLKKLSPDDIYGIISGYAWTLNSRGECAAAIDMMRSIPSWIREGGHTQFDELEELVNDGLSELYKDEHTTCYSPDSATFYARRGSAPESYASEFVKANDSIKTYFLAGKYNELTKFVPSYVRERMTYINNSYFATSEQERRNMSHILDNDIIFHYILSAAYYSKNYEAMGAVYDYVLFTKQIQLRTTQQINEVIQASEDKQVLEYFNEYTTIQKQLANSNPPASQNNEVLQERLNALGRSLAVHSSLLMQENRVSWKDIQRQLKQGNAAIEFVKFCVFKGKAIKKADLYAALVVTKDCRHPLFIPLETEKVLSQLHPDNPGDLYDAKKQGAILSQWVWFKLLDYFDKKEIGTIYFSPCGILNSIAIEALPYDKEHSLNYHHNIYRLSSTRQLIAKHPPITTKQAVLYGNLAYRLSSQPEDPSETRRGVSPLPGTQSEIDYITTLLSASANGFSVKRYTRTQGTEASFKELSGHAPTIIHLATHGFVDRGTSEDVMQQSGLIMAYGARAWEGKPITPGEEDGILTAAEIAAMDLRGTDVVVLSACNSGLGHISQEGVWGLQRAFKQAGVRRVVMSLWPIDDNATAIFMDYFYWELLKHRRFYEKVWKEDPQSAEEDYFYFNDVLGDVQERMRQHPQYSAPEYWAGFIIVD